MRKLILSLIATSSLFATTKVVLERGKDTVVGNVNYFQNRCVRTVYFSQSGEAKVQESFAVKAGEIVVVGGGEVHFMQNNADKCFIAVEE